MFDFEVQGPFLFAPSQRDRLHSSLSRATKTRKSSCALLLLAALVITGCTNGDKNKMQPTDKATSGPTKAGTGTMPACQKGTPGTGLCAPIVEDLDTSKCQLPAEYFRPGQNDSYPACVSDSGNYALLGDPPGSIGRMQAYEEIAGILWNNGRPCPADFLAARAAYERPQGLASRVGRREDLHFPPIPKDKHDPGLDADKQCSNKPLATAFPDRCAGPSKIAPLIAQSFIEGINPKKDSDPNIAAAKIKAGLLWFLYLSVYKEASTCFSAKIADCDSSWAYYTGGDLAPKTGKMLGLAAMAQKLDPAAHQAVLDGILAVRCVRDLYPANPDPSQEALPDAGKALFKKAHDQLDNALHRAYAVVLRQHLQAGATCSNRYLSNWTFLQIAGPVLNREAQERNPAAAQELAAIWGEAMPPAGKYKRAIELLDQLFPCPS